MGSLDPAKPGESIPEWVERTNRALDAALKNDCGQGFSLKDWLRLLRDYIEEA